MSPENLPYQVPADKIIAELGSKLVFNSSEEKTLKLSQLQEALSLSVDLHKTQSRKDGEPYINHIVRVTKRLADEYEVTDADVITAALLHDSVEDQSAGLSQLAGLPDSRANSLSYISQRFGRRVSFLVENLSNEEVVGEMSDDEWNRLYAQHVKAIIEKDPDLLFIKLSDFSDNALRLEDVSDVDQRLKLSKKYLPTMHVFLEKIDGASLLSKEAKRLISGKLQAAVSGAETFIASQNR